VPGNHDSFATADFLADFYDIKNIHGYSVKYKDVDEVVKVSNDVGIGKLVYRVVPIAVMKG